MAVTETEVAGAFSKIGEDPSDKDFMGKCERQGPDRGSRGQLRYRSAGLRSFHHIAS